MIQLTKNECQTFEISPIDYSFAEIEKRKQNINELYEIIDIIQDPKCLSLIEKFSNQNKLDDDIVLPNKMITFYRNYTSETSDTTTNNAIIKSIRDYYLKLDKKISSFAEKWNYEPEYVRNTLFTNEIFLINFIKEPNKQTFHQHYAAKWLKKIPFVEELIEPPTDGDNAFYVVNGAIIKGSDRKNQKTGKSIDFIWKYTFKNKELQFYATHKYTKDSGGSQDNQYRDVQEFHDAAKTCMNDNIYFLSITDGPYYLKKESTIKNRDMTKLDYLNSGRYRGERNMATTLDKFINDVVPIIIKWLNNNFNNQEIIEEIEKLNLLLNTKQTEPNERNQNS